MAQVVFFVPYSDLLDSARRIGSEYPDLVVTVAYVHTEQVQARAREFERNGFDIIIARGAQANIIKRSVKLPVIEFKASPQAISQTIFALRNELGGHPKIGLIALANTLPDVSCFSELFDVSLSVYAAKTAEELASLADTARLDGCQALIGGKTVMARASQTDTPCAFLRSGDEAICNAFDTANRVAYAMAELAQNGTLYLKNIETLSVQMQYKTAHLAQGKFLHNGADYPAEMQVRMIASTSADLISLVENCSFRSELYYALNVFKLDVPPLQKRRDDIPGWFDFYLERWQSVHHRWVHLTEGARQLAAEYSWPGGLDQINCVCERVVLLSKRNSVGEDFLREQIEQVFPQARPVSEKMVIYKDKKAVEIEELLKKYNGNRSQAAEELGVSKTTLWRYMKKYGIGSSVGE